jgi:hypothetical protein
LGPTLPDTSQRHTSVNRLPMISESGRGWPRSI